MKKQRRYNLKHFREFQGLTQEQMAAKLEVAKSTYVQIELGKANPSFALMEKFAETFDYHDYWNLFKKYQ